MAYASHTIKKPVERKDYGKCSAFVVATIDRIISEAINGGRNKIFINTNLKLGLPMENINKIAGPFVEAWACETFVAAFDNGMNDYKLMNVQAEKRLSKADVVLQFKKSHGTTLGITAEVDVKATAQDIVSSGKSPNITSFARIRTAYVEDPDYIFLVLSLKHRVYSTRNGESGLMDGIMEVVAYNTYDLKFISDRDFAINPALGTGQLQIRDIHHVDIVKRSTWEFCQLLDKKFLGAKKNTEESWTALATEFKWIK